jgi:hypothetical protein
MGVNECYMIPVDVTQSLSSMNDATLASIALIVINNFLLWVAFGNEITIHVGLRRLLFR